ncbi:MAG: AAA family ATPase [Planctomycetes bacterium]|nr:AAA family ATPase [Planctomycetota bacterium]
MTAFQITPPAAASDQASRLRELFRVPAETAAAPQRSAPVIAITSGKGGVGKTNLAVSLAATLAQTHRITLVDADLGMANADLLCGVSPSLRLQHALPLSDGSIHGRAGSHPCAGASLQSIAVQTGYGFALVPGSVGVAKMAELHAAEQRQLLRGLAALEAKSDAILLDTGAGISPGVLGFLGAADLVLVVATPEPTSIADAYALIKCLVQRPNSGDEVRRNGPSRLALVVNQSRSAKEAADVHRRMVTACEKFLGVHLPLAGWIARDPRLMDAVMAKTPVVAYSPNCEASAGIRSLSEVIRSEWLKAAREAPANTGTAFERLRRIWRLPGRSS